MKPSEVSSGRRGVLVDSTVASQREGPRTESWRGALSCVQFACSPSACVGFLRVLQFLAHTGDSKLPIGMCVVVCLYLTLQWIGVKMTRLVILCHVNQNE